jgi:hypothetical protein
MLVLFGSVLTGQGIGIAACLEVAVAEVIFSSRDRACGFTGTAGRLS